MQLQKLTLQVIHSSGEKANAPLEQFFGELSIFEADQLDLKKIQRGFRGVVNLGDMHKATRFSLRDKGNNIVHQWTRNHVEVKKGINPIRPQ